MRNIAALALVLAVAGASQAAVTFSVKNYDDNGAGYTKTVTQSGSDYILTFGPDAKLAPGDTFFLTYDTFFNSTTPLSGFNYTFGLTVTGATAGLVNVNLNGSTYDTTGNLVGTNESDLFLGGNANFSPSILIPAAGLSKGELQTSPYVINNTTDGTVTLDYIKISPVPEPASMAALAMGGLGMVARRRRRNA